MKAPFATRVFRLFAIAATLSGVAAHADLKLPTPELETLPNGLTLVWFLSENLPVTDIALLVKSGYRDDPAGKSGAAELLSAVLDRGNAGMSAQQLSLAIERLGASRYASADEDTFSVGIHGLSTDSSTLLDLFSKIVLRPDFPGSEVKREQERILDRWQHLADYGEALVSLAYRRIMTSGTSYGRGSLDSQKEFRKISRDDILHYYERNFSPKNSILMVVGRVDKAQFHQEILRKFGSWTGKPAPHTRIVYGDPRLPKHPQGILVIDRPDLTQAQVQMGFPSPLIKSPDHYALTVANALLGEYFNSRLTSLIRDKLALTYSIQSNFSYNLDFADFSVGSATRNEAVGPLIKKTVEVLKNLKQGPIAEEEARTAKEYLVGGFPLSTSTLGAVAARWLSGYVFERGPDYLNDFIPKISAVSAGEAMKAVARDFDLDHLVIVVAGDAKQIEKSLKDSGVGPVQVLTAKDLM